MTKKITVVLILTTLLIALMGMFSTSDAAIGSKFLTIKKLRESGYGYETLEKNVWEIVETNSIGGDIDYSATIYCLKGGPGFGSTDLGNGTITVREYTRYFDMKNPDQIDSAYRDALPTDTNTYNALLWLLEHVYISPVNDDDENEVAEAEAYKEQLLIAAGIDYEYCYLTEDDIDAVQQLAVWHFTNDDVYDPGTTLPSLWVNAVADTDGNYYALTDEEGAGGENGKYRQEDAAKLYNYLITEAEANAANYEPTPAGQPYEFDNSNLTQSIEEENGNYIIGPFKINRISDTEGTLEATFVNGEGTTLYPTYQDASGRRINNLEDAVGQEFYIVLPNTTNVDTITFTISGTYAETSVQYWSVVNAPESDQPVAIVERTEKDYSDEVTFVKPEEEIFDLALRKFITSITSGEDISLPQNRVPQINQDTINDLEEGRITTAEKTHSKTPLVVQTGDSVVYTIRVYNEGNVNAKVTEITDYLPDGLELKTGSSINTQYGWTEGANGEVTTDYLEGQSIPAFDGTEVHYLDVQIECEVTARVSQNDTSLKNIAEITGATDEEGTPMTDRDSLPDNLTEDQKENYNPGNSEQGWGYEDDDDYEELVIPGRYFDLALRKFITSIDGDSFNREPDVITSELVGGSDTTAIYNHTKNPLGVKVGDEIIYTIRVYNEGQLNGYVTEITDHLPANLEFVNDSFNTDRGWNLESDGRTVTTDIIKDELIEAFDGTTLDYVDVQIKVRVKSTAVPGEKLTNIAEISGFTDEYGEPVTDRDSQADNATIPNDSTLPNYRDDEINRGDSYIPGQQDDDDFEKVVVESFDLALRKFITGVNADTINDREPVFSIVDGKYTYTHTKDPVKVQSGDTVIYTLRIYNEGDIAGYADEVKDDIPEGLEFLPENTTNQNYRWVMYNANGEVTEDVSQAVTIRTDYLSKAQADETGRDNLLDAFDPDSMEEPDYKEVRVAFRVTEPNSSDRVIINTAEISEDSDEDGEPIDDEDSTPDNDVPEEDDIDIEKVIVEEFDLALRKYITAITSDGETTQIDNRVPQITQEQINGLLDGTIDTVEKTHTKEPIQVKPGDRVVYTIMIYNEGNINGYAAEITDYLPDGLVLAGNSDINTQYGWTNPNGDGKTIVTTALADDLIYGVEEVDGQGQLRAQYVQIECEVVAEYENTETSLKNVAEITGDLDENRNEVVDRDSTPEDLSDDQKNNYNPGTSEQGWGYQDDDDYEELVIPSATGDFEIKLIKVNGLGNRLSGATFTVQELNSAGDVINTYEGLTTDETGEVVTESIAVSGEGTYTFVITENDAPDGYEILAEPIRLEVTIELVDGVYTVTNAEATRAEESVDQSNIQDPNFNAAETLATTISLETDNLNVEENAQTLSIANGAVKSVQTNGNTVEITIENTYFDLALRKFVTSINGAPVAESGNPAIDRTPVVSDETKQDVFNRNTTTLEKTHTKTPLQVNTGDSVIYTIRVYNEGEVAGYATEITDYLPEGLQLKENSNINTQYGWTSTDGRTVTTDITSPNTANSGSRDQIYAERKEGADKVIIDAFAGEEVDYIDVQIECEVVAAKGETSISLKNVAEITGDLDKDKNEVEDRDSTPENLEDDQKNNYNPGTSEQGWGYEDDDDYEELVLPSATGDFELKLVKENGLGNRLQNAVFKVEELNSDGGVVNTYENLTTNELGEVLTGRIGITGPGTRTFVITETTAPAGYELLPEAIRVTVTISLQNGVYVVNAQIANEDQTVGGAVKNIQVIANNTIEITIENNYFDLALRKFITTINGAPVSESGNPAVDRTPVIDEETKQEVFNRNTTTLEKTHTKQALQVNTGDRVIYTIRVYNEGEVAGYASEITDYLPEGLRFVEDSDINRLYGWTSADGRTVTTDITSPNTANSENRDQIYADRKAGEDKVIIDAFAGGDVDYIDVQIECEVVANRGTANISLKNVAEITGDLDENKNEVDDRDSTPENLTEEQKNNYNPGTSEQGWGYEDDDDYEELVLPAATGDFNIKLIKQNGLGNRLQNAIFRVDEVNETNEVINSYENLTTNENGEIQISNIAISGEGTHTYVITEVQAPEGYEVLEGSIRIQVQISLVNGEYVITANQVENTTQTNTASTNAQSHNDEAQSMASTRTESDEQNSKINNSVSRVTKVANTDKVLSSVVENAEKTLAKSFVNSRLADTKTVQNITKENVTSMNLVRTNYSTAEKFSLETNENARSGEVADVRVNGNTVEIVIENNYFDLALRKFITGVNESTVTDREPVFSIENGEYVYTHTKEPVEVANGDTIIYTLRVYNEGTQAGYADEIKDDIPEGLEFLPEHSTNTEYRWVMYDANGEVTEDASQAVTIRTDYLSKAQEDETGRDNLIAAFDPENMDEPDYKEVRIAFRVIEPNTSDRIIINTAEITDDSDEEGEPVDDKDSTPDNDEEEEDDIDIEKVKVTYFDLALKKIITKVTMILDGETYVDETGHTFEDNPEEVVKVELGNHKIETSVIKFTYQIRVTNEGNKPGYAYEVKDYIPEGVEFVAEDNNEHWTLSEDGKTVTSDELADTLLGPGESATIEITLRWINGQNNLGVKTNWAEISEDSDDDIDSTPDNNTPGEDDIDNAEVVLSIVTGIGGHYIGVITGVLAILGVGIFLIKRYVL